MIGSRAGLGSHISRVRVVAQLPVHALVMSADDFRKLVTKSAGMELCLRNADILLDQTRMTAACNSFHGVAVATPHGPAGSAVSQKPAPIIIQISSADAISGQGSIIVLELADEDEVIKVAQKLALETRRCIPVRDAKMAVIETIAAASIH
jgi:hypothetical protein